MCRLAPASYVVRSFTMGKVYPTRASFSRSLPSMQTKVPRGLEGRSPRNPPRISISFSQSLPSMQTEIPRGLRGPKPKEPSKDLNICHQWRGQGTQAIAQVHDIRVLIFWLFIYPRTYKRLKGTLRYNGGKRDNFRMQNCSV